MTTFAQDTEQNSFIAQSDIDAAIAKVKEDPNLVLERKVRALRWRSEKEEDEKEDKEKNDSASGWFDWVRNFFTFVAETGRVIVWLALAAAVALLGVLVFRLVREIGPRDLAIGFKAPTHVRDLDIRPESLPDDIGAAALELWQRGEQRAALALLYRGLLSRLVHVHEISIRHSSTEGDCLALAKERLDSARADYAVTLIRTWQRAVYGAQLPTSIEVESLCNAFEAVMTKDVEQHQERAA